MATAAPDVPAHDPMQAARARALAQLAGPDVTLRQLALLLTVASDGASTVRRLADALGVSKPVITRAVNTLAGAGLARRERDPDDGRNVFISATPEGRVRAVAFAALLA